jgi:hypothetical protein
MNSFGTNVQTAMFKLAIGKEKSIYMYVYMNIVVALLNDRQKIIFKYYTKSYFVIHYYVFYILLLF